MRRPLLPLPSQEYLNKILRYDPETGELYWRESRGQATVGDKAGGLNAQGYGTVGIDGVRYKRSRIIHKMLGKGEPVEIDHRDGRNGSDTPGNIRSATRSQNAHSTVRQPGITGYRGVRLNRKGDRYIAVIKIDGKNISLGTYDTKIEASRAYKRGCLKYYGEFSYTERK